MSPSSSMWLPCGVGCDNSCSYRQLVENYPNRQLSASASCGEATSCFLRTRIPPWSRPPTTSQTWLLAGLALGWPWLALAVPGSGPALATGPSWLAMALPGCLRQVPLLTFWIQRVDSSMILIFRSGSLRLTADCCWRLAPARAGSALGCWAAEGQLGYYHHYYY